jgi:predicted aldo/keto reductase-like oxidoreductase
MKTGAAVDRRTFIKAVGAAGAVLGMAGVSSAQDAATGGAVAPAVAGEMPKRPFGRSGMDISMLGIGGMFDIPNNQIVMRQALAMGVTYWDTANGYEGGRSEEGIGTYFERNPGSRERVFLVTKGGKRDGAGLTEMLDRSLARMKTDHIDLYFAHGVKNIAELTDEVRAWAEAQKAAGKIKLFGFSTHSNMAACLKDAAGLGWIDGIAVKYDFRLMQDEAMKAAVDACVAAGIGLIAMKTQGGRVEKGETAPEAAMAQGFLERGFSDKQANLKAVWEDARIASIVSQMPNMAILQANVAAALDKIALTADDRRRMQEYADASAAMYCAGCTHRCEGACGGAPVGDVMRSLMYHREYGDLDLARRTWRGLPDAAREALAAADFGDAERACPQRLPIARLVREAAATLA